MLLPPSSGARLAAFDTGTTTGWAVNTPGGIVSGHALIAVTPRGKRWRDLRNLIDSISKQFGPLDAVYYERSEFIFRGKRKDGGEGAPQALSAIDRGGCYAVLEAWAYSANVPLLFGRTNQVKKALTGSGKADKPDMIEHASQICGRTIADHNEADSVGVLIFAIDDFARRRPATAV